MKYGPLEADGRMAAKSAVKIRAALVQTADFKRVFENYQATQPNLSDKPAQDRARARAWVMLNVRVNMMALMGVLERVYAEGWVTGTAAADELVVQGREARKAANDDLIDWSQWQPGDRAAALLLRPTKGFERFLQSFGVTFKDITSTTVNDIGNSVADALEQGLSANQAAKLISRNVGSPSRALTIAITEQNRAMSAATINRYREMQIAEMEWEVSDPCAKCAQNANQVVPIGGTFNSGSTQPPAHPNCRCVLLPVIPDFDQMLDQNGVNNIAPKPTYKPKPVSQDFQYEVNPNFRVNGSAVTNEQSVALAAYRGNGYGSYMQINSSLRGKAAKLRPEDAEILNKIIKERVEGIDELMKLAPAAQQDFISYRGFTGRYADELYELKPGQTFTDLGYSSTTLSRKTALESFAEEGAMIEIINPVGAKGIMMKGYFNTDAYKEQEWLLPRGSTFKVLSKTVENGITIIKAVVQ